MTWFTVFHSNKSVINYLPTLLKMCFFLRIIPLNSFWTQTQKNISLLNFRSIFLLFLSFLSAFLGKKHWKSIFQSTFVLHSTQRLVKIYNMNCNILKKYIITLSNVSIWTKRHIHGYCWHCWLERYPYKIIILSPQINSAPI